MKQIIVLIATILLGVSISGIVLGMGGDIDNLSTQTNDAITDVLTSGTAISAD